MCKWSGKEDEHKLEGLREREYKYFGIVERLEERRFTKRLYRVGRNGRLKRRYGERNKELVKQRIKETAGSTGFCFLSNGEE